MSVCHILGCFRIGDILKEEIISRQTLTLTWPKDPEFDEQTGKILMAEQRKSSGCIIYLTAQTNAAASNSFRLATFFSV